MTRDDALPADPHCDRCAAPIADLRSSVARDGQTYCCADCARADAADIVVRSGAVGGAACSRCGAPIRDRARAVTEGTHVFCCVSCAAAGVHAEPLPEV